MTRHCRIGLATRYVSYTVCLGDISFTIIIGQLAIRCYMVLHSDSQYGQLSMTEDEKNKEIEEREKEVVALHVVVAYR